jgi:hypothetical protein
MRSLTGEAQAIQGETCTIRKPIAAIQASTAQAPPLGPVIQLPPLSSLTVLGPAFNDTLVTVRCHESVYFVFLEDLAEGSVVM